MKEIEDKVIFDETKEEPDEEQEIYYTECEKEYSSPFYLAEKILDIINNYKKEYDEVDLEFIKNALEIVNENLNERVNI